MREVWLHFCGPCYYYSTSSIKYYEPRLSSANIISPYIINPHLQLSAQKSLQQGNVEEASTFSQHTPSEKQEGKEQVSNDQACSQVHDGLSLIAFNCIIEISLSLSSCSMCLDRQPTILLVTFIEQNSCHTTTSLFGFSCPCKSRTNPGSSPSPRASISCWKAHRRASENLSRAFHPLRRKSDQRRLRTGRGSCWAKSVRNQLMAQHWADSQCRFKWKCSAGRQLQTQTSSTQHSSRIRYRWFSQQRANCISLRKQLPSRKASCSLSLLSNIAFTTQWNPCTYENLATSLLNRTNTRRRYPRMPSTCSLLRQNHTFVLYTSRDILSHSASLLLSPTRHLLSLRLRRIVYPRNSRSSPAEKKRWLLATKTITALAASLVLRLARRASWRRDRSTRGRKERRAVSSLGERRARVQGGGRRAVRLECLRARELRVMKWRWGGLRSSIQSPIIAFEECITSSERTPHSTSTTARRSRPATPASSKKSRPANSNTHPPKTPSRPSPIVHTSPSPSRRRSWRQRPKGSANASSS